MHPTYRGAGLTTAFIDQACERQAFDWIECLTELGRYSRFLAPAGFVWVAGEVKTTRDAKGHGSLYGQHNKAKPLSQETHSKSAWADPAYFIRDNRNRTAHDPNRSG